MKIDKSKLKIGIWYEDENGNRIESREEFPEPVTKIGAKTYHSCFPLEITEHLYSYKSLRFGTEKQQIEVTETSKDGKEKKVKKNVDVASIDPNQYSEYARYFDKENPEWEKSDEYNLMFLKSQQNYANDLLKSKKYLFLNDVYDMLGYPRTQAGQFVGWFYDEENPVGDNFVDFNLTDCYRAVSGGNPEKTILLDFNVDGNIIDNI